MRICRHCGLPRERHGTIETYVAHDGTLGFYWAPPVVLEARFRLTSDEEPMACLSFEESPIVEGVL